MDYRKLDVWMRAVDLAVEVYEVTSRFPVAEQFGMVSQMRRAATSIASNIAEGEGRGSARDHLRFLGHARGSLYELDTQVFIAAKLGYLRTDDLIPLIEQTGRLINGTVRHLNTIS